MSDFFDFLSSLWVVMFGWMPSLLAIFCTILVGLVAILIIIKIIRVILSAIPFI